MNLLALIVMLVLTHIAFTGSRVGLMLFAIKLGASPLGVGILVSLLAVVPMLLAVHAGRWTDRVGVVKPALVALAMVIAGTLIPSLSPSLSSLYIASVLIGSGFMLTHLTINNAVGQATTRESRNEAFSYLALGYSISGVVGPLLTGFTIDFLGHEATFLVLAAFAFFALIVLGIFRRTLTVPARPPAPRGEKRVMDLLRNRPLRAAFIVSGLMSIGWDLFTFMVPLHGVRIGLSASTIGVIMASFGVGTFAVRLALTQVARRFGEWQILTGAFGLTAFVYLLFPLFASVPVLMGLAFVLGCGLGVAQPMVMSLIHLTAPAGRTGEAVGVRTTLLNASQALLPMVFGALGAAVGMLPLFWTLSALLSAGSWFSRKREKAVF